jgi:hypothetical protein
MGAFLEALFGDCGDLAAFSTEEVDFAGADLLVKNSNISLYYRASTRGVTWTQAVRFLSEFELVEINQ